MKHEKYEIAQGKGQFLVYQAEDGTLKLDVRLEDETVWLTQPLMADLFQTTQQNISQHILNIYEEEELAPEATHKKYLSVRSEGKREVKRLLDYYNLDILNHAGKISHEIAKTLAENEYGKFTINRINENPNSLSDFDQVIKQVETGKTSTNKNMEK